MRNQRQEGDIYKRIQDAISMIPENFSILEEQIDVELQMEYFNYSKDLKLSFEKDFVLTHQADLFNSEIPIEEKKSLLVLLASVEEVECFRTIEKYTQNPDPELREWSVLAFQESRMVLQSSLMDEQQVYISTGLGGKGQKLRYFVVFVGNNVAVYSDIQQKLIQTELELVLRSNGGILEELDFEENLALGVVLIPLKVDIQHVFSDMIAECNLYGDFIRQEVIITNVKRLSVEDIKRFIEE